MADIMSNTCSEFLEKLKSIDLKITEIASFDDDSDNIYESKLKALRQVRRSGTHDDMTFAILYSLEVFYREKSFEVKSKTEVIA